jgi:hypothetical protein
MDKEKILTSKAPGQEKGKKPVSAFDIATTLEERKSDLERTLNMIRLLWEKGDKEIIFTNQAKWDLGKMMAWMKLLGTSLDRAYHDLKEFNIIDDMVYALEEKVKTQEVL